MKIAIIGTGNLGLSIAKGILNSNGATTMYLTKRNLSEIQNFEKYGNVTITSDNREAVKNSDILILAVQPSQLESCFGRHQRFVDRKARCHFYDNRI